MNIFILDYDVAKCASYHNDKHVVKMITESAQMLSTACRLSGLDSGYKACYFNHPCNKWARTSITNWMWLKQLSVCLNDQWKTRFNHTRNHKACDVILSLPTPKLPDLGLTKFALAMPEVYQHDDAVQSYREYYLNDKRHLAMWRNGTPDWWI